MILAQVQIIVQVIIYYISLKIKNLVLEDQIDENTESYISAYSTLLYASARSSTKMFGGPCRVYNSHLTYFSHSLTRILYQYLYKNICSCSMPGSHFPDFVQAWSLFFVFLWICTRFCRFLRCTFPLILITFPPSKVPRLRDVLSAMSIEKCFIYARHFSQRKQSVITAYH